MGRSKKMPTKCQFLKWEAKILGFIVGNNVIKTDPKKIEAVREYPLLSASPKKVKQFLGFVGFYRRFIKNFAKIAKTLSNLLKKTTPFVWTKECQEVFEQLRDALCKEPVLQAPHMSQTFIVTTDASDYAIGAIISQGKIGSDLPCADAST